MTFDLLITSTLKTCRFYVIIPWLYIILDSDWMVVWCAQFSVCCTPLYVTTLSLFQMSTHGWKFNCCSSYQETASPICCSDISSRIDKDISKTNFPLKEYIAPQYEQTIFIFESLESGHDTVK